MNNLSAKRRKLPLRPIVLAVVIVIVGFVVLSPTTNVQITTLFAGLLLLSILPFVIDTGMPKFVEGALLGLLLGLPVGAAFSYWPIAAVFATLGCVLSCVSMRRSTNVRSLRLSTLLAMVAMISTVVWIYTLQQNRFKSLESSAVQIDRTGLSFSPTCNIIISVNANGEYVFGQDTSKDYMDAVDFLASQIEILLQSGAKPQDITIVGVTPHDIRHDQKIWMLREAFENVRGTNLHVRFEKNL